MGVLIPTVSSGKDMAKVEGPESGGKNTQEGYGYRGLACWYFKMVQRTEMTRKKHCGSGVGASVL